MSAFEIIASSPLILDNILTSMDLFDLYKARQICKAWKNAADAEIRKRQIASKVDCITIGYPVDKNRSEADTLKIFTEQFDAWKRCWESPPTILLVSPSFTFEFEMENNWVPDCCTCVVIEGAPVCVDGKHIETEDDDQDKFECCNLVALRSLGKSSVLASKSGDDTEEFLKDLCHVLVDPELKFLIVFADDDELYSLREVADKAIDVAARRGVVILCYSSDICPAVTKFQGREKLNSSFVAICFKGEKTSAASIFVDEGADGGVKELVDCWKKIDCARKNFVQSCPNHKMSSTGFCAKCDSQTLGFFLSPPHNVQFGYEEDDDNPRPLCFNQEQDAFRFIIPNVPLIGWLNDQFITGSTVNVETEPVETRILHPVDDVNFIFALLVLR